MASFETRLDVRSEGFAANRAHMAALLLRLRAAEERTRRTSGMVAPRFARLGKLLPQDRVGLLLDPGMPRL